MFSSYSARTFYLIPHLQRAWNPLKHISAGSRLRASDHCQERMWKRWGAKDTLQGKCLFRKGLSWNRSYLSGGIYSQTTKGWLQRHLLSRQKGSSQQCRRSISPTPCPTQSQILQNKRKQNTKVLIKWKKIKKEKYFPMLEIKPKASPSPNKCSVAKPHSLK